MAIVTKAGDTALNYKKAAWDLVKHDEFVLIDLEIHCHIQRTLVTYTAMAQDPEASVDMEVFSYDEFAMCVGDDNESEIDYNVYQGVIERDYKDELKELNNIIRSIAG